MATLTVQEVVAGATPVRTQQPGTQSGQLVTPGTVTSGQHCGQTIVTVGNLTAVQVQAAAHVLASAGIAVSGTTQLNTITTTAAGSVKGATVTVVQTMPTSTVTTPAAAAAASKALTQTHLQYFRQHNLIKHQQQQQQQRLQEQQMKKLQLAGTVATGTGATTVAAASATIAGAAPTPGHKVPLVAVPTTIGTSASSLASLTGVQIAGAAGTNVLFTDPPLLFSVVNFFFLLCVSLYRTNSARRQKSPYQKRNDGCAC